MREFPEPTCSHRIKGPLRPGEKLSRRKPTENAMQRLLQLKRLVARICSYRSTSSKALLSGSVFPSHFSRTKHRSRRSSINDDLLRSLQALALTRRVYSTLARRTSLMAQYQRVKSQFPAHLLLFQVGDFYELYSEDACELIEHYKNCLNVCLVFYL